MTLWGDILAAATLGLVTTSSSFLGAALGLYVPLSKRALAAILAFAAGSLISALAIELAYEGAQDLHHHAFSAGAAWAFIGGGFALGATMYYGATIYLEGKGAAVRYPTRFREYAAVMPRSVPIPFSLILCPKESTTWPMFVRTPKSF